VPIPAIVIAGAKLAGLVGGYVAADKAVSYVWCKIKKKEKIAKTKIFRRRAKRPRFRDWYYLRKQMVRRERGVGIIKELARRPAAVRRVRLENVKRRIREKRRARKRIYTILATRPRPHLIRPVRSPRPKVIPERKVKIPPKPIPPKPVEAPYQAPKPKPIDAPPPIPIGLLVLGGIAAMALAKRR